MRRQIQKFIESTINPQVASHGGRIELVDYLDKNVYIQMLGGCQGCAASTQTLKQGIQRLLMEGFGSEINEIIDVTDHGAGDNPYYSESPFG